MSVFFAGTGGRRASATVAFQIANSIQISLFVEISSVVVTAFHTKLYESHTKFVKMLERLTIVYYNIST